MTFVLNIVILFAFLASAKVTLAWVSKPTSSVVFSTIHPTRLHMFDWFNPKPRPKPEQKTEQEPPAAIAVEQKVEDDEAIPSQTGTSATAVSTEDHKTTPSSLSDAIHSGTVDWFDRKKGFGFIKSSDGKNTSVFVHQSQIQMDGYRCLVDGEQVEYRLEHDDKGRARAMHVTGPNGGDVKTSKRRNEKAS